MHYNYIFMHLDMCYICATDNVLVGLDWVEPMMLFLLHVNMFMHSHAYVLYILYMLIYLNCLGLFELFLFPSLSSVCISLLLWHLNANLLCPRTLFIPRHPLLLILLPHMSGSMMRRPNRTSLRTFLDEAFILNTKSSYQTSLTLTFPLSFTVGNGSHCVTSRSHVHLC